MMLLKKEYIIFKVSEKVIQIHMFVFYEKKISLNAQWKKNLKNIKYALRKK